ncbi:hypothetical protein ACFVMC_08960 [Nocardia sp. NPDC127579]|uniref:hypothetical protein n=1 Tax=Nocardia sp. NPDC127579 TaxID=3345402 RepID=UPI00362F8D49
MRPTDGRAITNPENAQNFSHAEIKQAADRMNPGGLEAAFTAWAAIAAAVTTAGDAFETALQQAIDQRWEGAAATAAVRGIREFTTRVGELGEALAQQSGPLSAAAGAATKFQAAIPAVTDSSSSSTEPAARNSQEEQARDDMYTYYIQPYGATAPQIPTLPAPIDPAANTGPVPDSPVVQPNTDNLISNGAKPSDTDPAESGKPAEDAQPSDQGQPEEPAPAAAAAPTPPTAPTAPTGESPNPTDGEPESTTPQSLSQNPVGTIPASVYAPTTVIAPQSSPIPAPAVIPDPSAPGPSAPGPSAPGTSAPQPGGSSNPPVSNNPGPPPNGANPPRQGTPVPLQPVPQNAPATAAPVAAKVAAPGAAGFAGVVARARVRREEDGEHRAKSKRSQEHTKKLIGDTEKPVPPVHGTD